MKYSIEQIKEMLAAATPGPWEYKVFEHDEYVHNGEMNLIIANGSDVSSSFCAATTPDLELISAAPTIIKDLLDEVERLRGVECVNCGHADYFRCCECGEVQP